MKDYKTALNLIEKYYGNKTANRSKVSLINHIYEGIKILEYLKSSPTTIGAYCIHPILQSDEAFNENRFFIPSHLIDEAILAMEYRRVANSYLSTNNQSDFVGFSCPEVKEMLIADKIQNYKDFLIHHKKTHERSRELDTYFNNWFRLLQVDYSELSKLIS